MKTAGYQTSVAKRHYTKFSSSEDRGFRTKESSFTNHHGSGKANFAAHSDLAVEITDPRTHSQTMIEDLIDNFIRTTAAANKKLFKKSNWDKYQSYGLILENLICQLCFFRLGHFTARRRLHSKQRENEQAPAGKRLFLAVYPRWLDLLMTLKKTSFGQD